MEKNSEWQKRCMLCDEVITNPICSSCLSKEVEQWLEDQQRPDVFFLIKSCILEVCFGESETECIVCSSTISVCPHCHMKEVYRLVRKSAPELADEFMLHFNYGLDYEHEHFKP